VTYERQAKAHGEAKRLGQSQRNECWVFAYGEATLAAQLDARDKTSV